MSLGRARLFGLATINSTRNALVGLVRTYSEGQVELWRKVPWLALQANGRTGYSDRYNHTASNGVWCVGENYGLYGDFVDCATGKLVDGNLNSLNDADVLRLAACIEKLDAEKIVAELAKEAQCERPNFCDCAEWERRKRWREECAQKFGLTETYVRLRPPEWTWSLD